MQLAIQGPPDNNELPVVSSSKAPRSSDAAPFLLELLKLLPAPSSGDDEPQWSTLDKLGSAETDSDSVLEDGTDLPLTGSLLPLTLPFPEILSPTLFAGISTLTVDGSTDQMAGLSSAALRFAPPDSEDGVIARSEVRNAVDAQGASGAVIADVTAELLANAGLELASVTSLNTDAPDVQNLIRDAMQGLLAGQSQTLIQQPVHVASIDSSRDQGIAPLASQPSTMAGASPSRLAGDLAPVFEMSVPVGDSGWDGEVAERVLWMVRDNSQSATIRLNPPGVGPLNVSIQMHDEQATVLFQASHAAVREALDVAVPRLREMLAEAGINLAGVNITGQGSMNHNHGSAHDSLPAPLSQEPSFATAVAMEERAAAAPQAMAAGLVDLYA